MLKSLSLLMILAGLAMGPAYWVYVVHFTGAVAQTLDLKADEHGGWYSAGFVLNPDMGAVGLVLVASGGFAPTMDDDKPPSDPYRAILMHGATAGQPIRFKLAAGHVTNSNPQFRERLVLMKQPQAGDYRLLVTAEAPPQISLDRAQLEVRSQVREPDNRLVAAGIALLALGLLLLLA